MVNKLVEKCTETVKEVKHNKNKHKCSSWTSYYTVLLSILFTINIAIGTHFGYLNWYLKKDVTRVEFGTRTQTAI